MHIQKLEVKNFRLLSQVELALEEKATVIVGRNNSGKTSLTELFRRLLNENAPTFRLEDFSLTAHEAFWTAFRRSREGVAADEVRKLLPVIEAKITVKYQGETPALGALSDFIIDVNPDSYTAIIIFRYQLKDGAIDSLYDTLPTFVAAQPESIQKATFLRTIRDRIPKMFVTSVVAIDPSDATNTKVMEWSAVRKLLAGGFITAQRGLDDITHKESDVLGKVLERLLNTAMSASADERDRSIADRLQEAVKSIQAGIDTGFNQQLQELLPAFSLFGYPNLADPELRTETTLDVQRLLTNHTRVHYAGVNGINLPEAYNGLGARNLIFILLKLLEFFKAYMAETTAPGIHLVFIEEPEVHLHPQMQEVFIEQLSKIAAEFARTYAGGKAWPVQFIVTTHSSHVANKAPFEAMRYFLVKFDSPERLRATVIKDLRVGLGGTAPENLQFLHKYMTLTRCDLLFADKAVLIEGTSERLLLPKMIEKLDLDAATTTKLSTQYLSVLEVGGAYAHLFFGLLDFLELPTLIITDLDSTKRSPANRYVGCKVSEGERTSNACIKAWFTSPAVEPSVLIQKPDTEKICKLRRLAYQVPESDHASCGRSLEGAFILANHALFQLPDANEDATWEMTENIEKSDFALKYAIEETNWVIPRYIAEGLSWLTHVSRVAVDATQPGAIPATTPTQPTGHQNA